MTTATSAVRPELAFSLRLSRASDDSSSIDVQRRACRAQAVALGFDPDTAVEYIDEDVSGASALESRTEGMARILRDRPKVVIAWKIDRFARSLSEFLKLVEWAEKHGVTLATADGALNTSSAGGRLVAKILASLAEWEREMIQERVTAAHEERRTQGRWLSGKAPFPYKIVREHEKAPAYLAIDEGAAALCREQIQILLNGGTLAATSDALPIDRRQWKRLLKGVTFRGWREFNGELVTESDGVTPVQFAPEIVDASTHARIQERLKELAGGKKAPRRNHPWLGTMVSCSRGCKMHGGIGRGKRVYKCAHGSIMGYILEPMVSTAFRDKHGDEPLYEVTYSGGIDHSAEMIDLGAARDRVTKAIAKVNGPALDTLVAKLTEIEAAYTRLEAEHAPDVTETWTRTNTLLWEAWDSTTEEIRRTLLLRYGCQVTVHPNGHPGGRVAITWDTTQQESDSSNYETAA
ncbi:recombinase family protein [Streptomyces morookaense]|uniref:recombinase family protein n=1 Tax=Streptomyces morookaense TaxID=1970 RepID=UPI0033D13720